MPCKLAEYAMPFDEVADRDFFKGLFRSFEHHLTDVSDGSEEKVKHIQLESKENFLTTDTLIIRPCYEHLLPHIHNSMQLKGRHDFFRCAVTGTPGIGKTLFGLFLLRHFLVDHQETVLYWMKHRMCLFSFTKEVKDHFGLSPAADEMQPSGLPTLHCGKWFTEQTNYWIDVVCKAREFKMIFIQDPEENDKSVTNYRDYIPRLVFILSHGHKLISHWNSKGNEMTFFCMPIWTKSEALRSLKLLKFQSTKPGINSLSDMPPQDVENYYYHFGGCIHGWVANDLWQELDAKIREVVTNLGDNVLQKSTNSRGSVIHLEVDFDENRPILPLATADSMPLAHQGGDEDGEEKPNSFAFYRCIFGSQKILEVFDETLLNRGEESLRMCLSNWAGQSGFESVYGSLFELHCHRLLESKAGQLKLQMRVVYNDKSKNNDKVYQVPIPKFHGTLRYPSNDPSILEEHECSEDVKTLCKHLWPTSSNYPTCDSAFVVEGKHLGVPELKEDNVALLLQMTVSGATGLPRRPEHSVKQHIRTKFEEVFQKRILGYNQSGKAHTVFLVPSECFRPFLFQAEENMQWEVSKTQPEFQLVIEIPIIFTCKKGSPHGTLRAVESPKKRPRLHACDVEKSSRTFEG